MKNKNGLFDAHQGVLRCRYPDEASEDRKESPLLKAQSIFPESGPPGFLLTGAIATSGFDFPPVQSQK
ncbi:MAG: hypothetical protein BGO21_19720 [Dyadobacter sp. 50-39]|nr:MAG: hypothetical protein BGO21_19720 [Dyadobacter sp. 50-39]